MIETFKRRRILNPLQLMIIRLSRSVNAEQKIYVYYRFFCFIDIPK